MNHCLLTVTRLPRLLQKNLVAPTHPQVRLQLIGEGVKGHVRPSALSVARDVVQHEGVRGLYSGLSASITRQATYGTARIGLHSQFSRMLRDPGTRPALFFFLPPPSLKIK